MAFENFNKLIDYIRAIQIKDDNDVFIGVTGRKGCGKSSFTLQTSKRYVNKYFGESYFSLKKYVAFNNEEVFERIHTLPKYSPLPGDEAIRFAWSRDWNKSENRELARLSTQIRTKKLIFFMNIPKLVWIDKAYREGMLDIWVWIHSVITKEEGKKCYALIFEPDENQGEIDSWHLKLLKGTKKRVERIGRFTSIDKIYNLVKNHPCFVDMFQFPKYPEDEYKEYLKLRNKKVFEGGEEFVDQKEVGKIMAYNIKNNWDGIMEAIEKGRFEKPTYDMIAKLFLKHPTTNKSLLQKTTIRNWIEEIKPKVPEQQTSETKQNGNNPLEE